MGTITSGVGLISGLDIDAIVSQLIAIEGRPKGFIESRNQVLKSQQVAYQDINARLLSLGLSANSFSKASLYDATLATSSDESVMTITSTGSAVPNNFAFTVDRLATAQQVITKGFVDSDTTAMPAGKLSFEFGDGNLATDTDLSGFNNGEGVRRGKIQITDKDGKSAVIDLTKALTVNDVLDKINASTAISVAVSATDTGFKLTDTSGGAGTLAVIDATGSAGTTEDLGLDSLTEVSNVYTTAAVRKLNENTLISELNDGNGLRMLDGGTDMTFTIRDSSYTAGVSGNNTFRVNIRPVANTDGAAAITVGDMMSQISTQTEGQVSLTIVDDKFQFNDLSGGADVNFKVFTHSSSNLMLDMGHSRNVDDGISSSANYNNEGVYAGLNDRLIKNLKGGGHVEFMDITGNGDMSITTSDATVLTVKMADTDTLRGAIDAINNATGNGGKIVASINEAGNGLQLKDTTGTAGISVASLNGSKAAWLLGLETGLTNNTLLSELNDGDGINFLDNGSDDITFTFLDGTTGSFQADDTMTTIEDLLDGIETQSGNKISATLSGTGIVLSDTSIWDTVSTTSLTAANSSGLVSSLGLSSAGFAAGTVGTSIQDIEMSNGVFDSGNLQLQYIAGGTLLNSMNGGLGVASGRFTITGSNGATATVNLEQGERTIEEVIDEINIHETTLKIKARINDNGDGILIEDTNTTGSSKLKIEESGSSTARDLGILGEADSIGGDIDGSFEKTIKIDSVALVDPATTLLGSLNTGDGIGVAAGDGFVVTLKDGTTYTIDTSGLSSASTVQDFLTAVTSQTASDVTASVNAQGTKLEFKDTTTGGGTFKITKLTGSGVTGDLGIAQTDTDGDGVISSKDLIEQVTLERLAQKINDAGIPLKATIINDGSGSQPFRLSFSGTNLGTQGSFIFDDGGLGYGATNLVEAQDAVVFYGSEDPTKALAITSSSNTLKKVVAGATIDLHSASSSAVKVQISRDDVSVKGAVQSFVDGFNSLVDTFDKYDKYDTETEERGLLLSDSTIARLRLSLYGIVNSVNKDLDGSFNRLSQLGIRVDKNAKLKFDGAKFDSALASDREGVKDFFSYRKTEKDSEGVLQIIESGMGADISELLERLTDSSDGVVERRMDNVDKIIKLNEDRIEGIDVRLEQKEAKLRAEFLAMEKILAGLQSQSGSLAGLANLAAQANNSRN